MILYTYTEHIVATMKREDMNLKENKEVCIAIVWRDGRNDVIL